MFVYKVEQQGFLGKLLDFLMLPIMYLLQGNFRESPQRTHRWNNIHLSAADLHDLDFTYLESYSVTKSASQRWYLGIPLFHTPIFGGWKQYVVLQPRTDQTEWFVGWIAEDVAGISKIPLRGPVRLLLGPSTVQFFGVDERGEQIDVDKMGEGTIGSAPKQHRGIPLL